MNARDNAMMVQNLFNIGAAGTVAVKGVISMIAELHRLGVLPAESVDLIAGDMIASMATMSADGATRGRIADLITQGVTLAKASQQ